MKEILKKEEKDFRILFLYFFIGSIAKIGNNTYVKVICYSFWILSLVHYMLFVKKTIRRSTIYFYLISSALLSYGVLMNLEYIPIQNLLALLAYVLPGFYVMTSAGINSSALYKGLYLSAYCNMMIYVPLCVTASATAYMDYAYGVLINTSVLLFKFAQEGKMADMLFGAVGCLCVFVYCSRGAAVVVVIVILFYCIESLLDGHVRLPLVVIAASIGAFVYIDSILEYLSLRGINSRNINKLLSNKFWESIGRNALREKCIGLIKRNPFGYGPLSNRKLLFPEPYPHNLILEILIDYGHYIGGVLIILLAALGIYLFINRKNRFIGIALIFYLVGFGILMVSNSFYYTNYFIIAAALFANSCYSKSTCFDESNLLETHS